MFTFTKDDMAEEIAELRKAQAQVWDVPDEDWKGWVNSHRDLMRLSGNDGYVPSREEWAKRAESFLVMVERPVVVDGDVSE